MPVAINPTPPAVTGSPLQLTKTTPSDLHLIEHKTSTSLPHPFSHDQQQQSSCIPAVNTDCATCPSPSFTNDTSVIPHNDKSTLLPAAAAAAPSDDIDSDSNSDNDDDTSNSNNNNDNMDLVFPMSTSHSLYEQRPLQVHQLHNSTLSLAASASQSNQRMPYHSDDEYSDDYDEEDDAHHEGQLDQDDGRSQDEPLLLLLDSDEFESNSGAALHKEMNSPPALSWRLRSAPFADQTGQAAATTPETATTTAIESTAQTPRYTTNTSRIPMLHASRTQIHAHVLNQLRVENAFLASQNSSLNKEIHHCRYTVSALKQIVTQKEDIIDRLRHEHRQACLKAKFVESILADYHEKEANRQWHSDRAVFGFAESHNSNSSPQPYQHPHPQPVPHLQRQRPFGNNSLGLDNDDDEDEDDDDDGEDEGVDHYIHNSSTIEDDIDDSELSHTDVDNNDDDDEFDTDEDESISAESDFDSTEEQPGHGGRNRHNLHSLNRSPYSERNNVLSRAEVRPERDMTPTDPTPPPAQQQQQQQSLRRRPRQSLLPVPPNGPLAQLRPSRSGFSLTMPSPDTSLSLADPANEAEMEMEKGTDTETETEMEMEGAVAVAVNRVPIVENHQNGNDSSVEPAATEDASDGLASVSTLSLRDSGHFPATMFNNDPETECPDDETSIATVESDSISRIAPLPNKESHLLDVTQVKSNMDDDPFDPSTKSAPIAQPNGGLPSLHTKTITPPSLHLTCVHIEAAAATSHSPSSQKQRQDTQDASSPDSEAIQSPSTVQGAALNKDPLSSTSTMSTLSSGDESKDTSETQETNDHHGWQPNLWKSLVEGTLQEANQPDPALAARPTSPSAILSRLWQGVGRQTANFFGRRRSGQTGASSGGSSSSGTVGVVGAKSKHSSNHHQQHTKGLLPTQTTTTATTTTATSGSNVRVTKVGIRRIGSRSRYRALVASPVSVTVTGGMAMTMTDSLTSEAK
ncbi:hypothetical protein BGZ94_002284 [Podila epigama]|nr:hypothetical protein BGZ94_002284 [Podila epigama]